MTTQQIALSPAELAYLHSSLSLRPPIRPDGRVPTQFRPLTAETGILPGTNGSARVCLADGTEAIVGIKAEIEKTLETQAHDAIELAARATNDDDETKQSRARRDWLEITVEIPGQRDDETATIFLAEMLREALLADGEFAKKLWINRRFHWRLFLDVMMISPPLSYPLPLLSLTTHLALLATRLPKLRSEGDEDPLFDDDWEASTYLYEKNPAVTRSRPPITLLVATVGENIIFDPSREELAVADTTLALSVAEVPRKKTNLRNTEADNQAVRELQLLSMRTIDPPSRLTPPGVPDCVNVTTKNAHATGQAKPETQANAQPLSGVWKAPLGGFRFEILDAIIETVLGKHSVVHDMLDSVKTVELA